MVGRSYVIKKTKNTLPWTYVIGDVKDEEIAGTFCEEELQKVNRKVFRVKIVIKRYGCDDKLYVKWKSYNNSFNSWMDKKDSVNEWIFPKTEIFMRKSKSWIRFV